MDVSALAALAAKQSVEALKASSQRHLAARARAMSPTSGPQASGRARGKALPALDNAARLTEEVSFAQALESIPTPLTTPPRIQSLQYTTLMPHSPPPSFSPARRGDTADSSNLSLWLGEALQAVIPRDACCAAPAPASGPQSPEELAVEMPRRRLSGKRPAPLRGPPFEETRCTAASLGPPATTELQTPMPRRRLSGKGPAHRSPTPALLSKPFPAPSSLSPSDEQQDLQASCLPSLQADVESKTDAGEQQRQRQQWEVVINDDLHSVSTANDMMKHRCSHDVETIIESPGTKQGEQEQKQYHGELARRIRRQEKRPNCKKQQQQQQQEKGQRASQRKDKGNSSRLSGQATSQGLIKRDANRTTSLDYSPTACRKKRMRPAGDTKRPLEQQWQQKVKPMPQPEPRQHRVAGHAGQDSMPFEARAAKRLRSHNCSMKRLKPLKMPGRRRTGYAEVSAVVGAVLACLHSATPVPVVAVDIPLGEDID
eukprot:TRINITY_DN92269_c0_g1_i1.p1 TRINITY_DN92269_c0_g1~~TRINITY_DN92269_c0_g1_i1.p1  ORF type:complete len:486 (+),score=80.08 TRINITY_DN92269_c0_g1_i1:82-1539(+)